MKFLTLEAGQLGALIDATVIDIPAAAAALSASCPAQTLQALVEAGDGAAERAWALALRACEQGVAVRAFADVKPGAPLPQPRRNILCLGKNYLDHAREIANKMDISGDAPRQPIIFTKATTAVIGPGEPIPAWPELTRKLDYEAELALIIGTGGRDIAPEHARDHVFGYTAINDISARDLQKSHLQWFRAKSFDGFGPTGPSLTTVDDVPDPHDLAISLEVNGQRYQSSNTGNMTFKVFYLVHYLSHSMTLEAGDIIATGTPAGVGVFASPQRFLKRGDTLKATIDKLGVLTNPVV